MIDRRTVLTGFAGASVASVLAGTSPAAAALTRPDPVLRAQIGSSWYGRNPVLQWEARRIQVAADKLRGNAVGALLGDLDALVVRPAVGTRDITRARNRLADVKLEMGQTAIRHALAADLLVSGVASPLAAAANRWAVSGIRMTCDRGTAQGFAHWLQMMFARNHLRDGLVACPDHYRIAIASDGRQNVIEVTGGAVIASEFYANYRDTTHVAIAPTPGYRYQIAAAASAPSGPQIGSIRHQVRNLDHGWEGSFNVAFPATLPGWFITEHRWHLACEFSNWITAYVRESRV